MSSADLCEIARSGVLHSGFPHACKKHWVAEDYWRAGAEGNDIHKTNVPNLRLRFRYEWAPGTGPGATMRHGLFYFICYIIISSYLGLVTSFKVVFLSACMTDIPQNAQGNSVLFLLVWRNL